MLAFIELFKTLGLFDLAAWQHVRIDERAIARGFAGFRFKICGLHNYFCRYQLWGRGYWCALIETPSRKPTALI